MEKEKICSSSMLDFYSKFDYVDFKYDLDKDSSSYYERYRNLCIDERNSQMADITFKNFGDMLVNTDLIYDDNEMSEFFTKIFDLFYNKIICSYLNIEGLERMFNEKYLDFEWNMHLGIDYKGHKRKGYRDHFIHQIRNAYMMHILLEKFFYFGRVKDLLEDGSKISAFIRKSIKQQLIAGCTWISSKRLKQIYNKEQFYYRNIIYMSSYICALFHDLAYPVCENKRSREKIKEFIPNLYYADSAGIDWGKIYAVLQNSLLFRVIDNNLICERVTKKSPDHGALSAVIFLMNFYENGSVYHIEPYKKCAVELAALAMFNHTNDYSEGSERISAKADPISYLLRICDDLQEWERLYFEVNSDSKCVICSKCKTPMFKKKMKNETGYLCNCSFTDAGKFKKWSFQSLFGDIADFSYRRVYNVMVCDSLEIERIDFGKNSPKMIFTLDYNLFKLLHICVLSNSYAKGRIKDLNSLKKLFDYQAALPQMYLKYIVTSNPILIKVLMVERYLDEKNMGIRITDELLETFRNEINVTNNLEEIESGNTLLSKGIIDSMRDSLQQANYHLRELIDTLYNGSYDKVMAKVKDAAELYLELYFWMSLIKKENQSQNTAPFWDAFIRQLELYYSNQFYLDSLKEIVRDCFRQFAKMYVSVEDLETKPEQYYEIYSCDDYTYGAILRYVSPDNNWPIKYSKAYAGRDQDFYTDLNLFRFMEYEHAKYASK